MNSIWSETVNLKTFHSLDQNMTVDTAVIGGGLAGILTAYKLKEHGVESIILEAGEICSGQTKNTTAKITSQHGEIYDKITKYYGHEPAAQYAAANENAIKEYEQIITQRNLECDFEKKDAYLYSTEEENTLDREYMSASAAGIDCYMTEKTDLPIKITDALVFKNQAQFHPLKFVSGIINDLECFEHTAVTRIVGSAIYTKNARIEAKNIVIATHYPFINFPSYYFLRMSQERSYVAALEGKGVKLDGMYIGSGNDSLSFRSYGDYILLGGGAHRTGVVPSKMPFDMLAEKARELYPNHKITAKWSAQDCVTVDNIPYIGRFGGDNSNIFIATGFGKWGMTSSMVSAGIISGLICGSPLDYGEVFSPQRFKFAAARKNIFTNTKETVKGFSAHLKRANGELHNLPVGTAKEIKYKDKKAGAYRDENGRIYIVTLKCPHLKCKLNWNDSTKTWDCPCHGSRYSFKGELVDNPAQQSSILIAEEDGNAVN